MRERPYPAQDVGIVADGNDVSMNGVLTIDATKQSSAIAVCRARSDAPR
jgi:hypothetical protein